jgi:hypothetical protein
VGVGICKSFVNRRSPAESEVKMTVKKWSDIRARKFTPEELNCLAAASREPERAQEL